MAVELRCRDVGLVCRGRVRADTREQLAEKVTAHASGEHDVELTRTLLDYALSQARER